MKVNLEDMTMEYSLNIYLNDYLMYVIDKPKMSFHKIPMEFHYSDENDELNTIYSIRFHFFIRSNLENIQKTIEDIQIDIETTICSLRS